MRESPWKAGRTFAPPNSPRLTKGPHGHRAPNHSHNMARAWWACGRPEQTTRSLLEAYRASPAEVRDRPAIRSIVDELAQRHPHTRGVKELHATTARQGR